MLQTVPTPDPRTKEILENIKATFAAKGFDGASMQDLARAAGMSAGNFYRYFSSKNAIVEAMVQHDLAEVQQEFTEIMLSHDPRRALGDVFRRRLSTLTEDDGPLWAEIEAVSSRNHEVGAIASRMQSEIVALLVKVFAIIADCSEAEADSRFRAHAVLVVMLVKGVAMQSGHANCALPRVIPADLSTVVTRMTNHIIAEIQPGPAAASLSSE